MNPASAPYIVNFLFPKKLLDASTVVELDKQGFLFQPGDPVESVYYVDEGVLRALRYQVDGKPAVMMQCEPGNFFATSSICLSNYPCAAQAPVKTRLLQIPKPVFLAQLAADPEFAMRIVNALSADLKKQCATAERLRLKSVEQRVVHFITCESPNRCELTLPCSLAEWADELGLEPESLYRTLSRMERKGRLVRNKRHLKLIPEQA